MPRCIPTLTQLSHWKGSHFPSFSSVEYPLYPPLFPHVWFTNTNFYHFWSVVNNSHCTTLPTSRVDLKIISISYWPVLNRAPVQRTPVRVLLDMTGSVLEFTIHSIAVTTGRNNRNWSSYDNFGRECNICRVSSAQRAGNCEAGLTFWRSHIKLNLPFCCQL